MTIGAGHMNAWLRMAALAVTLGTVIGIAGCGKESGKAGTTAEAPTGKGASAKEADEHKEGEAKGEHAEKGGELKLSAEEAERAGVRTTEAKPESLADTVIVTATIRPDQDRVVRVAPRIDGRVVQAPAKLGDTVRAGQTLATLDSVAVGEASASLAQARVDERTAEADFRRAEQLAAEEIIPKKEFLRAQAERDKAAAAVRNATDRLRLIGGGTGDGRVASSSFSVASPLSGVVIEKKVTLGELATPADAMFTVADLRNLWIQADVPEASLGKVRIGAKASIVVPAYAGEKFTGRVTHIGAMLDKDTRTIPVRVEVANTDGRLKPEMFATATIEAQGTKRDVIAVEDAAIVLLQGVPSVFVREHDGFEARPVEAGERIGGRTVITSGVQAGDEVVVQGAYALKARAQKSQLGHGH